MLPGCPGQLYINFLKARETGTGINDLESSRLAIYIDKKKKPIIKTKANANIVHPQWNQDFVFVIPHRSSTLTLALLEKKEHFHKSRIVASVHLDWTSLSPWIPMERWIRLTDNIEIHVILQFVETQVPVETPLSLKLPNLRLALERTVYFPGELIRGVIVHHVAKSQKIQGLYMIIEGFNFASWLDEVDDQYYWGKHDYFSKTETLFGKPANKSEILDSREGPDPKVFGSRPRQMDETLIGVGLTKTETIMTEMGCHYYPFEFSLPMNLPPSAMYGDGASGVFYYIQTLLIGSSGILLTAHQNLCIVSPPPTLLIDPTIPTNGLETYPLSRRQSISDINETDFQRSPSSYNNNSSPNNLSPRDIYARETQLDPKVDHFVQEASSPYRDIPRSNSSTRSSPSSSLQNSRNIRGVDIDLEDEDWNSENDPTFAHFMRTHDEFDFDPSRIHGLQERMASTVDAKIDAESNKKKHKKLKKAKTVDSLPYPDRREESSSSISKTPNETENSSPRKSMSKRRASQSHAISKESSRNKRSSLDVVSFIGGSPKSSPNTQSPMSDLFSASMSMENFLDAEEHLAVVSQKKSKSGVTVHGFVPPIGLIGEAFVFQLHIANRSSKPLTNIKVQIYSKLCLSGYREGKNTTKLRLKQYPSLPVMRSLQKNLPGFPILPGTAWEGDIQIKIPKHLVPSLHAKYLQVDYDLRVEVRAERGSGINLFHPLHQSTSAVWEHPLVLSKSKHEGIHLVKPPTKNIAPPEQLKLLEPTNDLWKYLVPTPIGPGGIVPTRGYHLPKMIYGSENETESNSEE